MLIIMLVIDNDPVEHEHDYEHEQEHEAEPVGRRLTSHLLELTFPA